jgi:DNA invertase Pin-like site-specific DNA recombinase
MALPHVNLDVAFAHNGRGVGDVHLLQLVSASAQVAADAKGKRLGRPRAVVSATQIASLRASGVSWRAIARELGIGEGTVRRACAKNPLAAGPVSACARVSAAAT